MLLLSTLKKVFWPIKWGSIGIIFANICSILGFFCTLDKIPDGVFKRNLPYVVLAMAVIIMFLRYFYLLNKEISGLETKIKNQNIWGEGISKMRAALSHINFLRKDPPIPSAETFISELIDICDVVREFFNLKTSAQCCVSIKVPVNKVNLKDQEKLMSLSFVNLSRDSHHPSRDNLTYTQTQHTVIGNTAYLTVMNNILNDYRNNPQGKKIIGYVNNNIQSDEKYRTTSPYDANIIPYNSEIVFPLIPIKAHESKEYVLVGLLCIDCDSPEKFSKVRSYETDYIETLADSLYDIIYAQNETKQWK